MAYHSIHSGPELDAAVTLLGDIQEARDATSADRQTVETLVSQAADDAQAAENSSSEAADAATGGLASLTPAPGKIPLADGNGNISPDWLGMSASGKTVATGTPAQGRTALGLGTAATADVGDFDPAGSAASALSSANGYTDSLDAVLRQDLADPDKGAAMVGMPLGYPGVIDKTVPMVLSRHVKLRAFGAKGNGIDDDTDFIEAAISSGAPLDWEGLTYRVTRSLGSVTLGHAIDWISDGATVLLDSDDHVAHVARYYLIPISHCCLGK